MTDFPFEVSDDGTVRYATGPRIAHDRLDRFRLTRAERALFALMERLIDRKLPEFRKRSVAMAAGQGLDSFQIAFPRTVNEKFAWRKVFDRDPRYPAIIDKIDAKTWVADRIPDIEITRLIWSGTDPEAIPATVLDHHAVMKPAHGCARIQFIEPGKTDMETVLFKARRYILHRWGHFHHEWGYFPIPSRVLVEAEMRPDPAAGPLEEIKTYLFNGRIERIIRIFDRFGAAERSGQVWEAGADGDVRRSAAKIEVADIVSDAPPPATWARVIEMASTLGAEFDHMRVDLLTDGKTIWLGELTVYSEGGRLSRVGTDPDAQTTRVWDLRDSWFLRTAQKDWRREIYRRVLRRTLDRAARQAARS